MPPVATTAKAPRRRTKTGCRACRERRIKCAEGAVDEATGAKLACAACVNRGQACYYPPSVDEWRTARATVRADAPSSSSTSSSSTSSPPIATSTPLRRILPRRSPETEQTLSSTLLRHIPIDGPASFVRPSLFPIFDSEEDATHLGYFVAGNVALRLNTFASTLPQFDSFKHRVIPYFSHNIAERRGDDADPADIKVLYHAAIRFSALHRAQTDTDTGRLYDTAAEHAQRAVEALEALPTKYSRSERLLLARVLLVLGNIVAGEPVEVSPSDLVANVTTPVGHDLYDVGCVWRTLTLCLREDKGVCTPVPLAGDRDLELTYGLSRRMWHILSRVNDLCSHARMLWSALGDTAAGFLAIEAQQLLQEAEEVTRLAEADETPRIRKGTEMMFHCIRLLLSCEVLGEVFDSSENAYSRMRMARLFAETPQMERVLGYGLPLTVAAVYCPSASERANLVALLREISLGRSPAGVELKAVQVPDLAWALAAGAGSLTQNRVLPWREACRLLSVSILL